MRKENNDIYLFKLITQLPSKSFWLSCTLCYMLCYNVCLTVLNLFQMYSGRTTVIAFPRNWLLNQYFSRQREIFELSGTVKDHKIASVAVSRNQTFAKEQYI